MKASELLRMYVTLMDQPFLMNLIQEIDDIEVTESDELHVMDDIFCNHVTITENSETHWNKVYLVHELDNYDDYQNVLDLFCSFESGIFDQIETAFMKKVHDDALFGHDAHLELISHVERIEKLLGRTLTEIEIQEADDRERSYKEQQRNEGLIRNITFRTKHNLDTLLNLN